MYFENLGFRFSQLEKIPLLSRKLGIFVVKKVAPIFFIFFFNCSLGKIIFLKFRTFCIFCPESGKKSTFVPKIGDFADRKRFSDLAENWLRWSSDEMTKSVFTHKRENFLMGLKMDFEFFEVGQIYKRFPAKIFFSRDFFYKLGGTNLQGISFIKFTKDFLYNRGRKNL